MVISSVIPQLRTRNLAESIEFYVSKLGFMLEFKHEDFYAGIKAGDQLFHLKLVDDKDPSIDFVRDGGHLHLYFVTDDIEGLAQEVSASRVRILSELNETAWGTKEFSVADSEGHVLYFGQNT
jgi:catechol 2,3-dioxygenase-like lactoylglutathione lyase family enzyme